MVSNIHGPGGTSVVYNATPWLMPMDGGLRRPGAYSRGCNGCTCYRPKFVGQMLPPPEFWYFTNFWLIFSLGVGQKNSVGANYFYFPFFTMNTVSGGLR